MFATSKNKITIITFTHFWREAPSTYLIESMLDSIYSKMDINECRHIINYDMKERTPKHLEYLENLKLLKHKYNNNIEITTYNTLRHKRSFVYIKLVEKCDTPYILFWEHDFILKKAVPILKILDTMDKHNNIKYIRFNKRQNKTTQSKDNKHKPIDYWIEKEEDITEIPLLKVCGYGGLPHIEKRDWFLDYCKPLMLNIHIIKQNDLTRAVNKEIYRLRESIGFNETHKQIGTYIYGYMLEDAYVESLDQFKSLEAWGNKTPNKKWRELND